MLAALLQKVGPCTLPLVDPHWGKPSSHPSGEALSKVKMSHQSHDSPEWVLLRNRREGLSVVDALFQSEPLGDKPGLVSLNLAFGVPLGLINLNPMGLAPSGNSNQPNLILVHGVHLLLHGIIPPRGILSIYGLWKRDWVIYKCTVLMQIQNVIIRNGRSPLSFWSPQCHFTSHRWCLMWGINGWKRFLLGFSLSLYHRLSFHSAWLFHWIWKGQSARNSRRWFPRFW